MEIDSPKAETIEQQLMETEEVVSKDNTSKPSSPAKEGEEEEEEVYVVEDIKDHKKDKNGYKYLIKWQGFSDADNTWETEENIFSQELIDKYWAKQPKGKDAAAKVPAAKKRKTKKDEAEKETVEEVVLDHAYPPADLEDWESEVVEVETVERNAKGELTIYLIWKNGCHTAHPSTLANVKCPQKIIEFYQNHLKFSE
ncbi:Chromobox protein 5 [Entomophthora muscae]|uniref:Chromobox protein 5 n=1 Tax=Entomophthora muscae TaxID=34485 RepID=A0ACC2RL48_9FUNG|nr:Chromobox protein 5 [Entomophthora muscae]